ncbi:MAG: SIR2 family protein [Desulfobacteraceae bacterium]|jgi:hypothetical protein
MSNILTEAIIEKLNKFESTPFLFVGSGLSLRYINAETWEGLLRKFADITTDNKDYSYEIYKESVKQQSIEPLTQSSLMPKIAGLIEKDFNLKWFQDKKFIKNRENFGNIAKQGVSPFKIEIADHFNKKKINYSQVNNSELNILRRVGEKSVSGIITTNYDTLLEEIFPGFQVFVGQDELLFSANQSISEIYKIHGCCNNPKSIIITDQDYSNFNRKNIYLVSKLLTIFIEHPIVFLGYSLSDENIEEILKSIADCLNEENIALLKERLFFVEWNNSDSKKDEISTFSKSFGRTKSIDMTRIYVNDFSIIYHALLSKKAKYNPRILRALKNDIYKLVLTNKPTQRMTVNINDSSTIDSIDYVIGVGESGEVDSIGIGNNNLAKVGYDSIKASDIYADIIYDSMNYDHKMIIEKTLPTLAKTDSNSLPIHKYLIDYRMDFNGCTPAVISKIYKTKYSEYLSKTILNNKKKFNELEWDNIDSLRDKYNDIKCIELIPYLNEDFVHTDELYLLIKDIMDKSPNILSDGTQTERTNLKRVIKIYDWKKYYQNK